MSQVPLQEADETNPSSVTGLWDDERAPSGAVFGPLAGRGGWRHATDTPQGSLASYVHQDNSSFSCSSPGSVTVAELEASLGLGGGRYPPAVGAAAGRDPQLVPLPVDHDWPLPRLSTLGADGGVHAAVVAAALLRATAAAAPAAAFARERPPLVAALAVAAAGAELLDLASEDVLKNRAAVAEVGAPAAVAARLQNTCYKTQMCRYVTRGGCRRGAECFYAHGHRELRSAPNLAKTSVCKEWQRGRCPLRPEECRFAHGAWDLEPHAYARTLYNECDMLLPPSSPPPPGRGGLAEPPPQQQVPVPARLLQNSPFVSEGSQDALLFFAL
mmetsp:Transcript_11260/g.35502  ORF Transcript_11260/g.35502 Transcript_11260/m.35502 type:complete len:329 (+) Transcript_11260:53-1039(+)